VLFLCPNYQTEVTGINLMPLLLYSERRWHHFDATIQEAQEEMKNAAKSA